MIIRGIFSALLLPVTLIVAVVANYFLLQQPISTEASSVAAAVTATLFVVLAEWVNPYTKTWRESFSNIGIDWSFLLLSAILLPLMQQGLLWLFRLPGSLYIWPHAWPIAAQVVLALILLELVQYTAHRLMHQNQFLWRFHAIHHGPEKLQLWCAFRNHPIDTLLTVALPVAPLAWLGVSPIVISYCVALVAANATLQHANANVRENFWSLFLVTPGLHRQHHVREARDAQYNFGGFLLIWDWVFATRRKNAAEVPELGIEGKQLPKSFVGQLLAPFGL